eukprot:TRINITY_DN504_c3_g1_i1.p1 TRINITY_DN504_c3_g1~~TRINITY_DN504_c3_g1_i1.p1  ORF type:complete len:205 (+),score=98.69 TRINITY_DN504_c3_g1_i1:117-731(+)
MSNWRGPNFDAKIVLLGDTGVGKTSIALRYVQDVYTNRVNPTIGASFLTKRITLEDSKIKFQIWDTAGQERFRSLAPMYYRGACAAILVFDICVPTTFDKVKEWVGELQLNVTEEIVIVIVGNKCDLNERMVKSEVASEYAKSLKALYFEASAKNNIGVENVFVGIARELISKRANGNLNGITAPNTGSITVNDNPNNQSGWCC